MTAHIPPLLYAPSLKTLRPCPLTRIRLVLRLAFTKEGGGNDAMSSRLGPYVPPCAYLCPQGRRCHHARERP